MKYIKRFNENIADGILGERKTLKDLKDNGLIYTVGAIKKYLKNPQNKWDIEYMPFPENIMILNILIGSKVGEYHFIKAQKNRGINDVWNWIPKINKDDVDSFPIPDKIYNEIVIGK